LKEQKLGTEPLLRREKKGTELAGIPGYEMDESERVETSKREFGGHSYVEFREGQRGMHKGRKKSALCVGMVD